MRPERPECQCLACAQLQHHQTNDTLLLVAIGTVAGGGWACVAGRPGRRPARLRYWPEMPLTELPASSPASATMRVIRRRRGRPACVTGCPALWACAPPWPASWPPPWRLGCWPGGCTGHRPPGRQPPPPHPADRRCHRPRTRTCRCCRRPSTRGGAVTATTLGARRPGLPASVSSAGDARGGPPPAPWRPSPALGPPCLPLLPPRLRPLLIPPSATVGLAHRATTRQFRLVESPTPAGRAQKPRATGRGLWGSCSCGGPLIEVGRWRVRVWSGPPPTPWGPPGGQPWSSLASSRVVGWLAGSGPVGHRPGPDPPRRRSPGLGGRAVRGPRRHPRPPAGPPATRRPARRIAGSTHPASGPSCRASGGDGPLPPAPLARRLGPAQRAWADLDRPHPRGLDLAGSGLPALDPGPKPINHLHAVAVVR